MPTITSQVIIIASGAIVVNDYPFISLRSIKMSCILERAQSRNKRKIHQALRIVSRGAAPMVELFLPLLGGVVQNPRSSQQQLSQWADLRFIRLRASISSRAFFSI